MLCPKLFSIYCSVSMLQYNTVKCFRLDWRANFHWTVIVFKKAMLLHVYCNALNYLRCIELKFFFLPEFFHGKQVIPKNVSHSLLPAVYGDTFFQNLNTVYKHPSRTPNSFVWYIPSLFHLVICSVPPKHLHLCWTSTKSNLVQCSMLCTWLNACSRSAFNAVLYDDISNITSRICSCMQKDPSAQSHT